MYYVNKVGKKGINHGKETSHIPVKKSSDFWGSASRTDNSYLALQYEYQNYLKN